MEQLICTGRQMKALHECGRSMYYEKLSLAYEGGEIHTFEKEARKRLMRLFFVKREDWKEALMSFYEEGFLPDWFGSSAEHEAEKKRSFQKLERMGDYLVREGYEVVSLEEPYQELFQRPLSYRGYQVNGIKGTYDMVLAKGKETVLVTIMGGRPAYSSRAKIQRNQSMNSPELLVAALGGARKYPGARSELWYMGNKDDSGKIMPPFEHRRGKNIVSYDFGKMTLPELFSHFANELLTPECRDCDRCFHKSVCQKPELRREAPDVSAGGKGNLRKKSFTDAQREVIEHGDGAMCVIAVPGAGKTTSLVQRMVRLIEKGVRPDKILYISFTQKAAGEIEERVGTELARLGIRKMPTVSTYNAFGFSILKENPLYAGGRRLKLAADVDRYGMIYKAVGESELIAGVSYSGILSEHGLVRQLDALFSEIEKNNRIGKDGEEIFCSAYGERKDVKGILAVYHKYRAMYKKGGYITYDDQISMANGLLEEYPQLRQKYARRYEYIMVDEYQDTSEEQAEMIYAIAKQHGNLVVVGDDDQSIYEWRGGSPRFMLNFQADFPEAKLVFMQDNFRSANSILSASNAIIRQNPMRYGKELKGHRTSDILPVYYKGTPESVIRAVKEALERGNAPQDICILARRNAQLDDVAGLLGGIVPIAAPKDYLVEDAVFLAIFDMLTLFYRGMDRDVSLYRILSYMGIDGLKKADRGKSLYRNMLDNKMMLPIENTAECITAYYRNADKSPAMDAGHRIASAFEQIAFSDIRTALEAILANVFGMDSHIAMQTICDKAEERNIIKMEELYSVMGNMLRYHVQDRVGYGPSKDAVNLLTCHDAKGKEFRTVIIYGMEDFKHSEEDMRILYVAMTRAEESLYLIETSMAKDGAVFDRIRSFVSVEGAA